ncbi:MAG: UTP--glucose-1-phosphate uridylyltransferase [Desulfobacterales bacterium]|nr:UTP--glucose-1-phosphate uridylyltransferase [Desulfobacterales bacterium]
MTPAGEPENLKTFVQKMEADGLPPIVIKTFAYYYNQVAAGETGLIYDRDLTCVGPEDIDDLSDLIKYAETGQHVFKNTVKIILNGGLGTTMGLTQAKSLIDVKPGKTFLEIILRQTLHRRMRLAFMNSFNTHKDTLKALAAYDRPDGPLVFLQHKFPKILQQGLAPAVCLNDPELEWNPPGHGDVYTALYTSGILQKLLDQGVHYAFIANSDNLGATVDPALLGYFSKQNIPFMMEVAERTPADLKGGHIARHKSGRLILRESAQCPKAELDAFRDIDCYRFFNTNNIWINLEFLQTLIRDKKTVRLPMILNPKTLDPRDDNSPPVYQLETAMGAAISLFEGARAVKIPKTRFMPVKTCNDLMELRSDRFVFTDDKQLILNPDCRTDFIRIQLDPNFYSRLDLFDQRFSDGIPSLKDCVSLTIRGDVRFEADVRIKGRVIIENNQPSQAVIKKGATIDTDMVLGD